MQQKFIEFWTLIEQSMRASDQFAFDPLNIHTADGIAVLTFHKDAQRG